MKIRHKQYHVNKSLPSLTNSQNLIPIVTDDEVAICNAIDIHLPKLIRVRCWNHTINSVKAWLRRHGATSADM